jgi:uncharacterized protein YjbI with pentapeptide repeats
MVRALREDVPKATLEFFRDPDPGKDLNRHWQDLREWYFDPQRGVWHVDWRDFQFPPHRFRGLGGPYTFVGATFAPGADFRRVRFHGHGSFYWAAFLGDVDFTEAVLGSADFNGVRFRGAARFWRTRFEGTVTFYLAQFADEADFYGASFGGDAVFKTARFAGNASFRDAAFMGRADFASADIEHGVFINTVVGSELELSLSRVGGDGLELVQLGRERLLGLDRPPAGPPAISVGPMSLARVEFRSFDPSELRLRQAIDIDQANFVNLSWPSVRSRGLTRPCTADERELRTRPEDRRAWAHELERIYAALRKNHEERRDRTASQAWYLAEMEVGRANASLLSVKRHVRASYRYTSGYGLDVGRPVLLWLIAVLAMFLIYLTPIPSVCPVVETDPSMCVGWEDSLRTVLHAVFLLGPPEGVRLTGLLATALWVFLRVAGLALIASITVAYRSQVKR